MKTELFGRLTWEPHDYLSQWRGVVVLPSLDGCRIRWNYDGTELNGDDAYEESSGEFSLSINPKHADSENATAMEVAGPYPEQHTAYEHFLANERTIVHSVLTKIAEYYVQNWSEYFRDDGADDALVDHVGTFAGIQETLEVTQLIIHNKFKDGAAYIGLGFNCSWEQEHGVGVLLHLDRIVDVGGEDTSFSPSEYRDECEIES